MQDSEHSASRRQVLRAVAVSGGAIALGLPGVSPLAAPPPPQSAKKRGIKLGFDNFSIRDLGWKAARLLDHASELGVDTILFSDLHVLEKHDDAHLREIKAKADDLGVEIQAGTGGVCPTSPRLVKDFGTAEEHLKLTLRVAHALGSKAARCYLGAMEDRRGPGGIERHIESTVALFKSVRGYAIDRGVKIAIENHAGDMQARELAGLVEAAGKDFVGVTVDSGNATWTLEDPVRNLEILAPYVVSSGIRDSMVWEADDGVVVQWTALGEGCVDLGRYFDIWEKQCPDAPVQLEIISGFQRPFTIYKPEFWGPYEKTLGIDLAAFVALAKRGKAIPPFRPADGADRRKATQEYQLDELARSVRYARETLGLGRRG